VLLLILGAPAFGVIHNFTVTMGQECPPCPTGGSPGFGSGTFQLDTATGLASFNITFGGLSAPETVSHVHGPANPCGGPPPVTAGVVYGLPLGSPKIGNSPVLTAVQQADMIAGKHYVNIHSQTCLGGEIRGQILEIRACCLDDGTCVMTTQAACGGTWGAPGSVCTTPQACCLPSGACLDLDPICCALQGGTSTPGPCGPGVCPCGPSPLTPERCKDVTCPNPMQLCQPTCVRFNPLTAQSTVLECECRATFECHVQVPGAGPGLARGSGNPCEVPDNGGGTVTLPPAGCQYLSPDDVHRIIDGLPPGTTIELAPIHRDFICHKQGGLPSVCSFPPPIPGVDCDDAGGSLGGQKECSDSTLQLNMQGTGALAGFMRTKQIPLSFETHTAPRTPGQPVQSFDTDMFRMFGQLPPGDPDFDLLRITGGTDFGLPSPGHTTLTQLPGGRWSVDSFFDITYRIDFIGAPGGPLAGMSGSTTGTIRMATGMGPSCTGACPPGFVCEETRVVNPDGTIDVCCNCVPQACGPDPLVPDRCRPTSCPNLGEECLPRCVEYNPLTGQSQVIDCDCRAPNECHVQLPTVAGLAERGGGNPCVVTGAGGTVTLPPPGCAYLSPQEVHQIIDGLPTTPPTTINLAPIHQQFICRQPPGPASVCSFIDVDCSQFGGTLGGEQECAESMINFSATGTGALAGFNRSIALPLSFETHIGPRTPGMPVQSFDTDMFRMFGQLPPGDPDFDLLRITGGTDFGLPSPGHTTLTHLGGNQWAVDSFFDITYRIDFVGAPGGPLAGMSGSTTGTIRMSTGGPTCVGTCPPGFRCRERRTINPLGLIELCCDCVPACQCLGDMNGDCRLNARDIQRFVDCFRRVPQPDPLDAACVCADMDEDGDIDMNDVALFVGKLLAVPKAACPPGCVPLP